MVYLRLTFYTSRCYFLVLLSKTSSTSLSWPLRKHCTSWTMTARPTQQATAACTEIKAYNCFYGVHGDIWAYLMYMRFSTPIPPNPPSIKEYFDSDPCCRYLIYQGTTLLKAVAWDFVNLDSLLSEEYDRRLVRELCFAYATAFHALEVLFL